MKRTPRILAAAHNRLIPAYNQGDGALRRHQCEVICPGRETGFHRMDERVQRTCGKDVVGQAVQKLRDQHSLVGKDRVAGEAELCPARFHGEDREVGHLAAGAAGGRYDNQPLVFHRLYFSVEQVGHGQNVFESEQLRHVNHRAAADAEHTPVRAFQIPRHAFHEPVRGLAGSVFFLK